MTTLVCMTPEGDGWVMRRWARINGRHAVTHAAGVVGAMKRFIVQDFLNNPPRWSRTDEITDAMPEPPMAA